LAILALSGALGAPVAPAAAADEPVGVDEPAAWIVVDASTGRVLAAHNEHEQLPPASMAKVMTALVAIERLGESSEIEISELAASQPPSKLGVVAGEKYRLDDAIAAMMLVSANDISYAIAETVGTDLDGFADLLNETADRYGMHETELDDPAGLDDDESFRGGPRMSAFDVAISIRNAQATLSIAKWAATSNYAFDGPTARFELQNHNKMLSGGERETAGVNGFKTGGTNLAGNTLAATATRDNRTMIVVIMNTPDTYAWAQYLFDLGFDTSPNDGTGETLPAPAVSVRSVRERDRDEFIALVSGQPIGSITSTSEAGTNVTTFVTTSPTSTTRPQATATTNAAATPNAETSGGGGSNLWIVVMLLIGLSVAFVARRAQIKRRKRQRARTRRERAAMMRRGSLPVVDGRYRPGIRAGNPPQSHIRVQRVDAPPEDDWEEWSGWEDEPPTPRR
jgi:D-alanyl-D-alanine carboxypeptidase